MELSLGRPLRNGVGRVSQWFGSNPAWYKRFGLAGHNGVDYACPVGSDVLAMDDAVIVKVANDPQGYGLFVKTEGELTEITYGHLSETLVKAGDVVLRGKVLGQSGNTGNSTGPHLHVTLKIKGMRNPAYLGAVDPVPFRD